MFTYSYLANGDVLRSDGIGMDAQNPEVLKWIAEGNVVAAYVPIAGLK